MIQMFQNFVNFITASETPLTEVPAAKRRKISPELEPYEATILRIIEKADPFTLTKYQVLSSSSHKIAHFTLSKKNEEAQSQTNCLTLNQYVYIIFKFNVLAEKYELLNVKAENGSKSKEEKVDFNDLNKHLHELLNKEAENDSKTEKEKVDFNDLDKRLESDKSYNSYATFIIKQTVTLDTETTLVDEKRKISEVYEFPGAFHMEPLEIIPDVIPENLRNLIRKIVQEAFGILNELVVERKNSRRYVGLKD